LNACNTAKGICNEELIKLKEQLLCPKPTLQSEMLQLVTSSFLKGAAYSILPEIVRNVLESRRYYGLSKIAPTLIEAGLIVYNTESYIPIFTCFAVRRGFRSLGFSEETSTTAASTAAVLANVVPSLIFSQETSINYMLNCSLAILASYAGSTLALTAKSCYNAYYDDWWSQILAGRCYLQIQEGSDQIQRNRALGSNPLFNVKEKDPLVKWSQIIRILTRLSMEKGETK